MSHNSKHLNICVFCVFTVNDEDERIRGLASKLGIGEGALKQSIQAYIIHLSVVPNLCFICLCFL